MFHVGVSAMEMEIWFSLLMIGILPCCRCTWRHIIGTMVWCPSLDPFLLSIILLTRFVLSAMVIHLMWSFKWKRNQVIDIFASLNKELMSKCIHIFFSVLCLVFAHSEFYIKSICYLYCLLKQKRSIELSPNHEWLYMPYPQFTLEV